MIGYISVATVIPNLANCLFENQYRGVGNGILNGLQYVGSFLGPIVVAAVWAGHENLAFIILFCTGIIGAIITKVFVIKENFN